MKSNNSSILSRLVSNTYVRNFLTGAIALLARIVQHSVYEKIELVPAELLNQLVPGEPVLFAASHTGRFVDVTSILLHLLSKNWGGIQIITWDGFVPDPELRKVLRMLPLDNQFSRKRKKQGRYQKTSGQGPNPDR